jgi:hypothetical protein
MLDIMMKKSLANNGGNFAGTLSMDSSYKLPRCKIKCAIAYELPYSWKHIQYTPF